jgi:hypothetical protein
MRDHFIVVRQIANLVHANGICSIDVLHYHPVTRFAVSFIVHNLLTVERKQRFKPNVDVNHILCQVDTTYRLSFVKILQLIWSQVHRKGLAVVRLQYALVAVRLVLARTEYRTNKAEIENYQKRAEHFKVQLLTRRTCDDDDVSNRSLHGRVITSYFGFTHGSESGTSTTWTTRCRPRAQHIIFLTTGTMQTSYYGPTDSSIPAKNNRESEKDYRSRIRSEMVMKVSVWARSPSPPAKKGKEVKAAPKAPIKVENIEKDSFGRDLDESKSSKKVKEPKEPVSSSDSDSESSSDSSDSSRHHKRSRGRSSKKSSKRSSSKSKSKKSSHKKHSRKHKKRYSSSSSSSSSDSSSSDSSSDSSSESEKESRRKKRKADSASTEQRADPAGGNFDEFDQDEAKRFRMEVQGGGRGPHGNAPGAYGAAGGEARGYESESDGEEVGPMPMVQPKAYSEDKKVCA